jgi:four helix bundle protein
MPLLLKRIFDPVSQLVFSQLVFSQLVFSQLVFSTFLMNIKTFEDIIAWQKGQELAVLIYGQFGTTKEFWFKDQICRATVSISSNIAKGFGRSSDADFNRFLQIALGSCFKVKSLLLLAEKLNYLNKETTIKSINHCDQIGKLIGGFSIYLKK